MGKARRWVLNVVASVLVLAVLVAGAARVEAAAPQVSPPPSFVDPAAAFYGCGLGAAFGALTVAFPGMASWARAGALPGMGAVFMRSGLGCYYGVLSGVAYSGVRWTTAKIKSGWQSLF